MRRRRLASLAGAALAACGDDSPELARAMLYVLDQKGLVESDPAPVEA